MPQRSQYISNYESGFHIGQVNHAKLRKTAYEAKNNRPEIPVGQDIDFNNIRLTILHQRHHHRRLNTEKYYHPEGSRHLLHHDPLRPRRQANAQDPRHRLS